MDNKLFVSCIDRYSKYLYVHSITNKLNFHESLKEILTQQFPDCETLMTDNEAIFTSHSTKNLYEKYKIAHFTTLIQHSTSNSQVERVHSTLIELTRCLAKQNSSTPGEEIFNAVRTYNSIIHSYQ